MKALTVYYKDGKIKKYAPYRGITVHDKYLQITISEVEDVWVKHALINGFKESVGEVADAKA